jgi:hypothetical protein
MDYTDWMVFRRFLAKGARGQHEAITRFYRHYEHNRRVVKGADHLAQAAAQNPADQGAQDRWQRYRARHQHEFDAYAIYKEGYSRISKQFGALRHLYRDTSIDADTLDRRITQRYNNIISEAKQSLTARARMASE